MEENKTDPAISKIAEGASALRDCATSIRARLQGREQTLQRLRGELSALRSIADITLLKPLPPPPAPEPIPIPPPQTPAHPASPSVESILADLVNSIPVVEPVVTQPVAEPIVEPVVEQTVVEPPVAAAPIVEELVVEPLFAEKNFIDKPFVEVPISEQTIIEPPVAVEKPKSAAPIFPIYTRPAVPPSVSSPKAPRSRFVTLLPIICLVIISALLAFSRFHSAKPTAAAKPEAESPPAAQASAPPPLDEKSADALAMVRQWRMAGDEKTLFMRLGGVLQHPNGLQAWSVEKLDEGSYLVIYREAAGTPIYAFEAKLKNKTVMPSPEATERLTLIRVRDQAAAALLNVQRRSN